METLIKPSSNMFHFDNIYYDKPMITNNFSIFQIGDLFCKSDTVVGDHQQLYQLELSFVVEGSGTIFTNDIPTKVNKGDIYISLKDETHKLTSDSIENMRYYYFALNFNTDSPYAQIIDYLEKNHKSEKNRVITLPNIFPLMTNILSELIDMKLFSLEIIESNIQQILISIYRRKDNKSNLYVYTPDIRKGMAYNIVNYIDQNYASIENLIEIATKFNYDY
ncbi:MAG: AraC family ligand binding domain-containing protein, partial [Clostridia bacterium]